MDHLWPLTHHPLQRGAPPVRQPVRSPHSFRHFDAFWKGLIRQPNPDLRDPPLLFQLNVESSEKRNVAADHLDVIARIQAVVTTHKSALIPGEPQLK